MKMTRLPSARGAIAILLISLMAGFHPAVADHDPNIIHACSKNKSLEVVGSPADCKRGEMPIGLATEAALSSLQGSNEDLQSQLNELGALVRRLHGNQAAVVNDIIGAGKSPGTPGGYLITLTFCDKNIGIGQCDSTTGVVLATPLVADADEGSVITFNAGNTPNFDLVVDLLTNGENDVIMIETSYQRGDGSGGGGGSINAQESSYFFRNTQTTTGPEFDDLTGLEIDRVDITIDRVLLAYDSTNDDTSLDIDYRIFFGLAP